MSTETFRANILLDTISTSASVIFAGPWNTGQWTSITQVPRYLYTSLADLCSGFVSAELTFNELVVADYGLAAVPATACIILQPSEIRESADEDFLMQDAFGAEYSEVDILVKNLRTSFDIYFTKDVGLRLRYILDLNLRSDPNNQFISTWNANNPNNLASSDLLTNLNADTSIYPNVDFKARWIGSGILRVSQQTHRFCCDYQRFFTPNELP